MDVLRLVACGYSNKCIARALGLAEGTVKLHVTAVLRALGVSNRTEAVLAATALRLVGAPAVATSPGASLGTSKEKPPGGAD